MELGVRRLGWLVPSRQSPNKTVYLTEQDQTNALLLAAERHWTDTVVNALLDHLQDPSHLDIQDSVCSM